MGLRPRRIQSQTCHGQVHHQPRIMQHIGKQFLRKHLSPLQNPQIKIPTLKYFSSSFRLLETRLHNLKNDQYLSMDQCHEQLQSAASCSRLQSPATGNWTQQYGGFRSSQTQASEGLDWESTQVCLSNRNGRQLSWCHYLERLVSTTDGALHQVGVSFTAYKKGTNHKALSPGLSNLGAGSSSFLVEVSQKRTAARHRWSMCQWVVGLYFCG